MPIKCPVCGGVATHRGGAYKLSEFFVKKWYTCKTCGVKTPANVVTTILYDEVKKGR